jgi:hypothetical protein
MSDVAAALAGTLELSGQPYDPAAFFWRTAEAQHVDLLLIERARACGADRCWPEPARQLARCVSVDATVLHSLRDRELSRVLARLSEAGLACLILKGAALAHTLYRQPHTRRRSDADLLIQPADADRVTALLEADGYVRAVEISGDYATSQLHLDRSDAPDSRYALDIHWRIVNAHAFADAIGFDEFAASRIPVPGLGPHAWTLCTAHALALACIHAVAHHPNSDDLLWLWDVHLLVAAMTGAERDAFVDVARRSAARAVCAHTLAAADARFGTPGAAALIDQVRPRPGDAAELSAQFLGSRLSLADILRSDLASLGWRRGAVLLREHLFPPTEYMRAQYHRWPAVLLPAAYIHRIMRGAPKWLRRP